jgi:hypothetical protein
MSALPPKADIQCAGDTSAKGQKRTYAPLGRAEEARSVLSEMEKAKPTNAKEHWKITNPYADAAHERQLLDGLRRAQLFENDISP